VISIFLKYYNGTTGGVSLRLKKFNLDEMNPLAVIVAIGKRRSGKVFSSETYCRDTSLSQSVLSCPPRRWPTSSSATSFQDVSSTKALLKTLVSHRFPQSAHGEDEIRTGRHGKSDIDPKNFIMDDLGYDAPIWVKNKDIKFLFMNVDISTHFSFDSTVSQGYPPALRTNVDYTFIFREPNMTNKILYDNYAGMFATLMTSARSWINVRTTTNALS
jgi:hypothetical protein